MASTNKTSKLGLNSWLGTDHPTRNDFVQDNTILDNIVGNHCDNYTIHLTSSEKERISSPILVKQYAGTGSASLNITFTFSPKFLIVQKKNSAPVSVTSSGVLINAGVTTPLYGGTQGLSLNGKTLTVLNQSTFTDGAKANFNELDENYNIIAFR